VIVMKVQPANGGRTGRGDDAKTAVEEAEKAVTVIGERKAAAEVAVAEAQAALDAIEIPEGVTDDEGAALAETLADFNGHLAEQQQLVATLEEELKAANEAEEKDDALIASKTEELAAAKGKADELEQVILETTQVIESRPGTAASSASAAGEGGEGEDGGEDGNGDPEVIQPTTPEPEEEEEPEPEPEPEMDPLELLRRKREVVEALQHEQYVQADLIQRNTAAQAAIAEIFRQKKKDVKEETAKTIAEQDERYHKLMASIEQVERNFEEKKAKYTAEIETVTAKRDLVMEDVEAKQKEFYAYKRKIAKQAVSHKTGKPMKEPEWLALEAAEKEKEKRVRMERLKYIKLRNQLQAREKELRQKEQLADGLHFIDFEQLKIENQTYNEKIEERNEELSKLRTKITMTVQVLSHLKEKLHFVEQDNTEKREELKRVEASLAQKRDQLSRAKRVRDKLRKDNLALNHECGLIGQKMLLRDYEQQFDELESAKQKLQDLQLRHHELTQITQGYKDRLSQLKAQEPELFGSTFELPPIHN